MKKMYETPEMEVFNFETTDEIKVQFSNKQSYTYRTPVDPTSISRFKKEQNSGESDGTELQVYVTYAVQVVNESSTLKARINSIINCFDTRYTLESAKINKTAIKPENITTYNNQVKDSIYKQPGDDYREIKLNNLNILVEANKTSTTIYLRYKVSIDAVKDLLNKDATMSNAVEIESYTTYYGSTSYPSKKDMGSKVYAGYDRDSQPGNAGIKLEEVDYKYTFTYTTSDEDKKDRFNEVFASINIFEAETESNFDKLVGYAVAGGLALLVVIGIIRFIRTPEKRAQGKLK